MIELTTNYEKFNNELCEVVRLFFEPDQHIAAEVIITDGDVVTACANVEDVTAVFHEEAVSGDERDRVRQLKHAGKIALFRALKERTGIAPPWGSLTGIRPTKFIRGLVEKHGEQQVRSMLSQKYDVTKSKIELAFETIREQQAILASIGREDYDVYIGVPFCRTRCVYCSFVSYDYNNPALVGDYLAALKQEINQTAEFMHGLGKKLRCVYIGGGTPTALNCGQLEGVLSAAVEAFGHPLEFTVEAGRPDTIDEEKLKLLKNMGVGRISINPQSMNDATLAAIGRNHRPEDIYEKFALARGIGFDSINMDLIAGLPGEDERMFKATLCAISGLAPDNLTVHTLAVKRSSALKDRLHVTPLSGPAAVARMVELSGQYARSLGMEPYYLYRQKYMSGNLENVGYCTAGKQGIYNIDIMEEAVSILALGANAITKWVGGGRIERAPNPKDIATYISNIGMLVRAKRDLFCSLDCNQTLL